MNAYVRSDDLRNQINRCPETNEAVSFATDSYYGLQEFLPVPTSLPVTKVTDVQPMY